MQVTSKLTQVDREWGEAWVANQGNAFLPHTTHPEQLVVFLAL